MKLKDISPNNRPLERLEKLGSESLSNAELLAIILKTGTKEKNVLDLCFHILSKYTLEKMSNCTINELCNIKGIGKVKAAQIKAIFEFHKRIEQEKINSTKIISVDQISKLLKYDFENKTNELLIGVFLNYNTIISKKIITIGTSNNTLISQTDILREAIKENANCIIIAHNHPSQIAYPSKEDIIETNKLNKLAKELNINLLDHLIFTKYKVYSFKKNNIL
jgi:DNA repair protein RadC